MSGGSGYVLSKEAVVRLVEIAFNDPKLCFQPDVTNEDLEIGKCLANVHVLAGDGRDSQLRGRFMPFSPKDHLFPRKDLNYWYWTYRFYGNENYVRRYLFAYVLVRFKIHSF